MHLVCFNEFGPAIGTWQTCCNVLFCVPGIENSGKTDASGKDLLPCQEARSKAGLEKAVKHKDKLLEFDKTRSDAGCDRVTLKMCKIPLSISIVQPKLYAKAL